MTLTELIAEVYTLTNRPDLVAETLTAVRASTQKMHNMDVYYKDQQTALITMPEVLYVQSFDTSSLARYRGMGFIRKWYPTGIDPQTMEATGRMGAFLEVLATNSVLDAYGRERSDVYYIAGVNVNVRLKDALDTLVVAWYQHPDISVATYDSWIAEEFPYAIVYDAAAVVFKTIGYDEQRQTYAQMSAEQVAMIKMSNTEIELR